MHNFTSASVYLINNFQTTILHHSLGLRNEMLKFMAPFYKFNTDIFIFTSILVFSGWQDTRSHANPKTRSPAWSSGSEALLHLLLSKWPRLVPTFGLRKMEIRHLPYRPAWLTAESFWNFGCAKFLKMSYRSYRSTLLCLFMIEHFLMFLCLSQENVNLNRTQI